MTDRPFLVEVWIRRHPRVHGFFGEFVTEADARSFADGLDMPLVYVGVRRQGDDKSSTVRHKSDEGIWV